MNLEKVTDREYIERLHTKIDKLEAENKRLGERHSYVVNNEIKNNASYTDRIQELEAVIKAAIEYHESRALTSGWHDIQVNGFRKALED